jgi:hypothetical protein
MGYSCTRDAQDTLATLSNRFATDGNPNILTMGTVRKARYFFERGRENEDGAITGRLMVMVQNADGTDTEFAQVKGSVKIAADGTIERWPNLIARDRREIENSARDLRARNPQLLSSWNVPL